MRVSIVAVLLAVAAVAAAQGTPGFRVQLTNAGLDYARKVCCRSPCALSLLPLPPPHPRGRARLGCLLTAAAPPPCPDWSAHSGEDDPDADHPRHLRLGAHARRQCKSVRAHIHTHTHTHTRTHISTHTHTHMQCACSGQRDRACPPPLSSPCSPLSLSPPSLLLHSLSHPNERVRCINAAGRFLPLAEAEQKAKKQP